MKTKGVILILCLILTLVGCGKTATESGRLVKSNTKQTAAPTAAAAADEEADSNQIPDGVVAIVNGEELKPEDFGYYIYNAAVVIMYEANPNGDPATFDWNSSVDGKLISETAIQDAINDAIGDTAFRHKAKDAGYSVSEAERTASDLVDDAMSRSGDESFRRTANALGISNAEQYKKVYTNIAVFDDVAEDFQKNPSRYISNISQLSEYADDRGASVQQILILNTTDKGDPLALAQEVNRKAKNGEDFTTLMNEYNEDSITEQGYIYTFTKGEMVQSFENSSFALKIGEISDIVQSDYGYHTIKRVSGAYELRNYWRAQSDVRIADNASELLDFNRVIKMVKSAAETAGE